MRKDEDRGIEKSLPWNQTPKRFAFGEGAGVSHTISFVFWITFLSSLPDLDPFIAIGMFQDSHLETSK